MRDLKVFTKLSKTRLFKRSIAGITAVTMMLSTTACNNDKYNFKRKDTSSNSISTDMQNNWDTFNKDVSKNLTNNNINFNNETLNCSVTMLNFDAIMDSKENKDIIDNYYKNAKSINVYNDGEQLNKLLSSIYENNIIKDSNANFFKPSTLVYSETKLQPELNVINVFEKDAETLHNYYLGIDKEVSKEAVESIFNNAKNYLDEKISINDYYYGDLSYGTSLIVENLMQQISFMSEGIIPNNDIIELNTKLKEVKTLDLLEIEWFSYGINNSYDVSKDHVDVEFVLKVNKINTQRHNLFKTIVECVPVRKEQIFDLYAISNIDYFMSSEENLKIFNYLYRDFDLDKAYINSDNLVQGICIYNGIPNCEKLPLSDFIIDNNNDKLSIMGIEHFVDTINFGEEETVNNTAKFLLDYSKNSEETAINVNDSETGNKYKLRKKDLSNGASQIVNWQIYYTVILSEDTIKDEKLRENIKKQVDGTNESSNIYSKIDKLYSNNFKSDKTDEIIYTYKK